MTVYHNYQNTTSSIYCYYSRDTHTNQTIVDCDNVLCEKEYYIVNNLVVLVTIVLTFVLCTFVLVKVSYNDRQKTKMTTSAQIQTDDLCAYYNIVIEPDSTVDIIVI